MAAGKHHVAIVVFCEADGVDERDAQHVAERSLFQLLAEHTLPDIAVGNVRDPIIRSTKVLAARELGMAMQNGYLTTSPTNKAYRD